MKIIEGLWRDYMVKVYPDDVPDAQHHETKQAFYAGITSCLMLISTPKTTEQEAINHLDQIARELDAYSKERVQFLRKGNQNG